MNKDINTQDNNDVANNQPLDSQYIVRYDSQTGQPIHSNLDSAQLNLNTKKSNGQFIISLISFILFAVILLVLCSTVLYVSYVENGDANWGWMFVIIAWLSILPLLASFIMSIISIILYLINKKPKRKIERIFYILNWITIIILVVPMFIIFVIS